jgi:hypothetical protein
VVEHEQAIRYGAFLAGVLTGSHTTRQRLLRQAKAIQAAIINRSHRENPWTWQQKYLALFFQHADSTRYYYLLTVRLLTLRLGKKWQFNLSDDGESPYQT